MRRRARIAGVAAMAVLTIAPTAAAAAPRTWSPPIVAAEGRVGTTADLAPLPNGGTIAVWEGLGNELKTRRVLPRRLGRILSLGRGGEVEFRTVVTDPRGSAVVVWIDRDAALQAVRLTRNGRIGKARRIADPSETGAYGRRHVDVAIDAAGTATIVWSHVRTTGVKGTEISAATAHARTLTADGALSPIVDLPGGDGVLSVGPEVAATGPGRATVAWTRIDGDAREIVTARLRHGALAGPATPVSTAAFTPVDGYQGDQLDIAAGPGRSVTVAWPAATAGGRTVAVARVSSAAAVRPRALAAPTPAIGPAHVVATRGTATVVWRSGDGPYALWARRIGPSGRMGPARRLGRGPIADTPKPAIDRRGRTTVAWLEVRDTPPPAPSRVRTVAVREIGLTGAVGRRSVLLRERSNDIFDVAVAAAAPGRATVGWIRFRPRALRSTFELVRRVRRSSRRAVRP